jgi:hypothetical protein
MATRERVPREIHPGRNSRLLRQLPSVPQNACKTIFNHEINRIMKITHILQSLLLFTFLAAAIPACVAQDKPAIPAPVPEGYQSCCGTQPVVFKSRETSVYIPNVFTPNGDGINDLFTPIINSEVIQINNYTILTPDKDTVLYHATFVIPAKIKDWVWTGKRYNGSVYSGPFRYGMLVMDKQRRISIIEGEACAIPCRKEMAVFKTKEGCYYSAQAGAAGTLDSNKPNAETDCF